MKNILIVTQYFYPENFIINGLAENLANKGCNICVYTGYPSYPHKKFYKNKDFNFANIHKNIEIKRFPVYLRRSGRFNLSLHYLSFLIMGIINSYRVLGRGSAWLDTGTFQSLMQANQYVQVIEERQGRKIGCIEEAAYRMGYIDDAKLLEIAEPLRKSGYGEYLVNLAKK